MRQGLRVLPCRRLKAWGLSMAVKAQRARVTEEGLRPIPVPPSLPPCPEQRKDGFDFGLKASSKQILRQGLGRRGSHADLLFCEVLTAAPVLFFQKKKKRENWTFKLPKQIHFPPGSVGLVPFWLLFPHGSCLPHPDSAAGTLASSELSRPPAAGRSPSQRMGAWLPPAVRGPP